MADGKLSVGEIWAPPPTSTWNAMVDAGLKELRNRGGGSQPTFPAAATDTLTLKNSSGADLPEGRVLEIGAKLLTTIEKNNLWFTGSTPAPDGTKGIAVSLRPIPINEIARNAFQISGVCRAKVNIVHEQQTRADVDSSSTLLQSKWYGRAEILAKESTGTGEKACLIRLGEMFRGPIDGVVTEAGGIAMNTSGEVTVYLNDTAMTGTGSTVEAHYTWLYNADLTEDQRVTMNWYPDRQKFVIRTPWC